MKNIKDLLYCDFDIVINGITDDSRLVKNGYLFVATKGYNVDHFDYVNEAIKNGCAFLVVDRKIDTDFPHIIVDNVNDYYRELCKKYYEIDLSEYDFYGVTGTDGKTTTATILSKIVDGCAYIGTNGLTVNGKNYPLSNTTPCVSELYNSLKKIREKCISNISMEVSSEALLHGRVDDFKFKVVGITNITGDHLSIHKSFSNYLENKLHILDLVRDDGVVLVNGDDKYLEKISRKNCYTYGFSNKCDYYIKDTVFQDNFVKIMLEDKMRDCLIMIVSPFIEKFNIYNVVLAYLMALYIGIDEHTILEKIRNLSKVEGRCEELYFGQNYKIILDYAHTINAVKNILDTCKCNKLITVTGAAGGRDKEKRPVIGQMVIDNSDVSIFTMDDPRGESVNDIIDQMVGNNTNYIRIIDREEAIKYALSIASEDSTVLIMGKGRDNYMAIGDKKIPYSDYDVIKKYFDCLDKLVK